MLPINEALLAFEKVFIIGHIGKIAGIGGTHKAVKGFQILYPQVKPHDIKGEAQQPFGVPFSLPPSHDCLSHPFVRLFCG